MTTTRFMMVAAMMSAAAAAPLAIAEDPAAAFRELCEKKAADGDSMAVAGADGYPDAIAVGHLIDRESIGKGLRGPGDPSVLGDDIGLSGGS